MVKRRGRQKRYVERHEGLSVRCSCGPVPLPLIVLAAESTFVEVETPRNTSPPSASFVSQVALPKGGEINARYTGTPLFGISRVIEKTILCVERTKFRPPPLDVDIVRGS